MSDPDPDIDLPLPGALASSPHRHPAPPSGPRRDGWLMPRDVAREAGVTPRTVQNWCDLGVLRCERLPSGHRRIPAAAWDIFRTGGSREQQDAIVDAPKRREELEWRIRHAKSPQEIIEILRGP